MELVNEFKALADKTRLRIIALLFNKSLCVCEIMDILEMTQSRISRHMGILKQAGFIEEERKGKWVIYRIADKENIILPYVCQKVKENPGYAVNEEKIKETLKKKLCLLRED